MAFLNELPEHLRATYVEHIEANNSAHFVDPAELEPAVRAALEVLRNEADQMRTSGVFGHGMGTGGRLQHWIKAELLTRYGISWRTPREMNPDIAFD